jgi:hypothetical protein
MGEWRSTLNRNWPYMITATLISVFLWVAVSADTVEQRSIDTEVVFIMGDPGYVLTEQEPSVQLVSVDFIGGAGDLARLAASRPQIFVSVDSVESLVHEVLLQPDMVRDRDGRELGEAGRNLDVRAVAVRPSEFRLHFQPRGRKVVRVVARVNVTLANGYMIADSPRVEPSAVAIEGPESLVEGIDSVVTGPVQGERLRQTIDVEVPLERPVPDGLVQLSSPSVRVTVPVEPRLERAFPGIPLSVRGAASGSRVEPSLVDVRISGPTSAVEAVRPEALSPRVELSGPADYGVALPLVLPAPGPYMTITLDPDSARVVRGGGTN